MPGNNPDNTQHLFFSADFSTGVVTQVRVRQSQRLSETLDIWKNDTSSNNSYYSYTAYGSNSSSHANLKSYLALSETHLIVKNDSNISEVEKLFVEEVYEFEQSNTLTLRKWRILQFSELFHC